jgi:hypothetical protein
VARLGGHKGAQTCISAPQSPSRSWRRPPGGTCLRPCAKVWGSQTDLLTPWYDGRAKIIPFRPFRQASHHRGIPAGPLKLSFNLPDQISAGPGCHGGCNKNKLPRSLTAQGAASNRSAVCLISAGRTSSKVVSSILALLYFRTLL